MPDFLKSPFAHGPSLDPLDVLLRLTMALALGSLVALIYRYTRPKAEIAASFPGTLVLLAVLIAMVTQVIGDNVARAFSLVGALAIVRFRTVVRDTQDTAYVIFAVVIGMSVGAQNLWVAALGLVVIGFAAFTLAALSKRSAAVPPIFLLNVRVGMGHDLNQLLGETFEAHLLSHELVSLSTARQGIAQDIIYEIRLRPEGAVDGLIKALNLIEGVQTAEIKRSDFESN